VGVGRRRVVGTAAGAAVAGAAVALIAAGRRRLRRDAG
jgi:hypothetical protein